MKFITADFIFLNENFSVEKVLVVDDFGKIISIEDEKEVDELKIQKHKGILVPGFINTHCHLELSHLKNKVPQHTGLPDFVQELMGQRFGVTDEERQQVITNAEAEMIANGIVAVGDISNETVTIEIKKQRRLFYHTFVELYGLNPTVAEKNFEEGKKIWTAFSQIGNTSLAPHAPYSVSNRLNQLITEFNQKEKFISTLHNQETEAEELFFKTKTGDFISFYNWLKADISFFQPTGKNSIESIISFLPKKEKMLFVHNTFTSAADIELLINHNPDSYFCTCPKANLYIENRLPDYDLFLAANCQITIGTDSLASNNSLCIFDEMKTIYKNNPKINLQTLLTWATKNGAEFLGIENQYGTFEINKTPGINLLENATPDEWMNAEVRKVLHFLPSLLENLSRT